MVFSLWQISPDFTLTFSCFLTFFSPQSSLLLYPSSRLLCVSLPWQTHSIFWLGLNSISWGAFLGSWPSTCFISLWYGAPEQHYDRCAGFTAPGAQGWRSGVHLIPVTSTQAIHACYLILLAPKRVWSHFTNATVTQRNCLLKAFARVPLVVLKFYKQDIGPFLKLSHSNVFLSWQEKVGRQFLIHAFNL